MTSDRINYEYFNWLKSIAGREHYSKVLSALHEAEFNYDIPMDGNRADDGINLRYRFGREAGYDYRLIALYLDSRPCSILEMMIALAIRCKESIVEEPDLFWAMMNNTFLSLYMDWCYNEEKVDHIIKRLVMRYYDSDGFGGLFYVPNCQKDIRSLEIWDQMCLYLNYIMREETGK